MKRNIIFILFSIACCVVALRATQQPVNGVFEGRWDKNVTNEVVDYCVWESTNGMVKWRQILETTTNWFRWTNNNITPLTFYAVTQIPRNPPGSTDMRRMSEMRFLHWAPSGTNLLTNASSYVRLEAIDVVPGHEIALSSDLKHWDDWITPTVFQGTNELTNVTVRLKHHPSAAKPYLFFKFATEPLPAPAPMINAASAAATNNGPRNLAPKLPPPLP